MSREPTFETDETVHIARSMWGKYPPWEIADAININKIKREYYAMTSFWGYGVTYAMCSMGYIDEHEMLAIYGQLDAKHGMVSEKTKALVKSKDGNRCTNCESINKLHVHHIVGVRDRGIHDASNLITLCDICHLAIHRYKNWDAIWAAPMNLYIGAIAKSYLNNEKMHPRTHVKAIVDEMGYIISRTRSPGFGIPLVRDIHGNTIKLDWQGRPVMMENGKIKQGTNEHSVL